MKSRELELVWNLEARGRMDLLNYAMASFGDKKSLVPNILLLVLLKNNYILKY